MNAQITGQPNMLAPSSTVLLPALGHLSGNVVWSPWRILVIGDQQPRNICEQRRYSGAISEKADISAIFMTAFDSAHLSPCPLPQNAAVPRNFMCDIRLSLRIERHGCFPRPPSPTGTLPPPLVTRTVHEPNTTARRSRPLRTDSNSNRWY